MPSGQRAFGLRATRALKMSASPDPPDGPAPAPETDGSAAIVERIASELSVQMARVERVEADCAALRLRLRTTPSPGDLERLVWLGAALRNRSGAAVAAVARLLESAAENAPDPWPLLEPLLVARDRDVARGALGAAWRLAETGRFVCGRREALALASALDVEESPLGTPEALRAIAALLRANSRGGGDGVLALFLDADDLSLRVLAARLLDVDGAPAPAEIALQILGEEAHGFLRRYLDYSRAGHLDLLHLAPARGQAPVVLDDLRRAEAACGEKLLR